LSEEIELPRASYATFSNIIKSFLDAHANETAVSTKKVALYAGRHPTIVSQNIKAITFLGIVTRAKGFTYKLTKDGVDLAYSIDYKDEEGTSAAFRSLVSKNEFLRSLIFSVKNRGSTSNYELRDEIAKRAKIMKKDTRATIGAQTIIDLLVISGFLMRDGDNIKATERVSELLREGAAELPAKFEVKKPKLPPREIPVPSVQREIPMEIQIRLDFQVPLHPEEDDVKSIADTIHKIRDLLVSKVKEEE